MDALVFLCSWSSSAITVTLMNAGQTITFYHANGACPCHRVRPLLSSVSFFFFFTNNNLVHVCFHVLTFGNVRHSTHLLYSTWVLQSQDNYLRSSGTFIKLSVSRHTGFWVCSSVMNVRLSLDNRKKSLSFHFCDLTGASLQKAAEVLHSKWFFFRQLVSLCRHINDGRSVIGTI